MQHLTACLPKTWVLAGYLCLSLSAAFPQSASRAIPSKTAVVLDQNNIHAAYNEGDFDKVTGLIDGFSKANKTYSRADSIFIAKHLAVVYSANPRTREKGKYHMYRLLEMLPSAELVDMFVSDEIDRIFDKVRREYITRQKAFGVDSTQISMPDKPDRPGNPERSVAGSASAAPNGASTADPGFRSPANGQEPGPSSEDRAASGSDRQPYWKRNGFWFAGGAGLIVAGTTAFLIYSQDEPTGRIIVIPSETSAQK